MRSSQIAQLYPRSPLAQGVACAFDFQSQIGSTVFDVSGNGNTGQWQGTLGSQWGSRLGPGKSGVFNGSTNYVISPLSHPTTLTTWSLSAWVSLSTISASGTIIGMYVGNDSGGFGFGMGDGAGGSGTKLVGLFGAVRWINSTVSPFSVATPVQVVITYANTSVSFYVNGVLVLTSSGGSAPNTITSNVLTIGGEWSVSNALTRPFPGSIGQSVYWNGRALTPNDVNQLYAGGLGKAYPFN